MTQEETPTISKWFTGELLVVSLLTNCLFRSDHSIIASAYFDEAIGQYFPLASVVWKNDDGTRGIEVLNDSSSSCATCVGASNLALKIAKAWIDRKLG